MKNRLFKTFIAVALVLTVCLFAGCTSSYDWFVKTIEKYYYYPVDASAFDENDLKGNANKFLDRYSAYYTKEEYAATLKSNAGSKSGLGISYSYVPDRGVYISSVSGNSPAYICGLRAGEWLKSGSLQGGEEADFASAADFQNLINSASDGVKLNLTSTDGTVYTAAKSQYTASYTYMAMKNTSWVFKDSASGGLAAYEEFTEAIDYLPEDTAYIKISQFYGTASKEFDILIEKFNASGCKSLILDLRSNGGGYVSIMQDIAYSFSDGTNDLAMLARDKNGREEKFKISKVRSNAHKVSRDVNVYVLANSGTASASEALMGAMISYGALKWENVFLSQYGEDYMDWLEQSGQELKTSRTYGKGIMQSSFENGMTGEVLKLTTAQIYWPDKTTCIHDKGLTVGDGCTPVYTEWQHTKSDGELKAAVDIIKSR